VVKESPGYRGLTVSPSRQTGVRTPLFSSSLRRDFPPSVKEGIESSWFPFRKRGLAPFFFPSVEEHAVDLFPKSPRLFSFFFWNSRGMVEVPPFSCSPSRRLPPFFFTRRKEAPFLLVVGKGRFPFLFFSVFKPGEVCARIFFSFLGAKCRSQRSVLFRKGDSSFPPPSDEGLLIGK